jgi:hypothetical protein
VLVEILVFGRNEGLQQLRRDRLDRLEQPAFARVLGQQGAVSGVDAGGYRRLIVLEDRVVRELAVEIGKVNRGHRNCAQGAEHAKTEEPAKKSQH